MKADVSFWEFYAKANYAVTDSFGVGAFLYYSPSVLNSGADGIFFGGNAKYTFTAFANGVQPYISGEVGYWDLGTSDVFYAVPAFPTGIPYKSYTTWSVGVGWTYKVFTSICAHRHRPEQGRLQRLHRRSRPPACQRHPRSIQVAWAPPAARALSLGFDDLTVNTNIK
jgi:hypothetical protein